MERSLIFGVVETIAKQWRINPALQSMDDKEGVRFAMLTPKGYVTCWATEDFRLILGGKGELTGDLTRALSALCLDVDQQWRDFRRG